jgi:hypothetical protein
MPNMGRIDPEWTLPSRIADKPMAWMVMVDGMIVDIRRMARELQQAAFAEADSVRSGTGTGRLTAGRWRVAAAPQHFLYFFPLPHGQGSLRPTLAVCHRNGFGDPLASDRLCRWIPSTDSGMASVSCSTINRRSRN